MALEPPDDNELKQIIEKLCLSAPSNAADYKTFIKFYNSICSSIPSNVFVTLNRPAFTSHSDVLRYVDYLRCHANSTKNEIELLAFPDIDVLERNYGTRLAVKVGFMIDCASKDYHSEGYRLSDNFPVKWESNQTFVTFLQNTFPTSPSASHRGASHNRRIKAWKLKKRHGISFIPTNDLVQHLLYDGEARTVKVFHQTAFLKAHLRHGVTQPLNHGFDESLKSGSLPSQLLLETLHSIHYILFPISEDHKSAKLVRSLIRKSKFDPDLLIHDGCIRALPENFEHVYWGNRLRIIQDMTSKPPPKNILVSWVERHTSERNALSVAILGLILVVVFGFLSLLVGVAQLIVSILAWKYPQ